MEGAVQFNAPGVGGPQEDFAQAIQSLFRIGDHAVEPGTDEGKAVDLGVVHLDHAAVQEAGGLHILHLSDAPVAPEGLGTQFQGPAHVHRGLGQERGGGEAFDGAEHFRDHGQGILVRGQQALQVFLEDPFKVLIGEEFFLQLFQGCFDLEHAQVLRPSKRDIRPAVDCRPIFILPQPAREGQPLGADIRS